MHNTLAVRPQLSNMYILILLLFGLCVRYAKCSIFFLKEKYKNLLFFIL